MSDLGPRRYRILAGAIESAEAPRRRFAARAGRVVAAATCWLYGLALCGFHAASALAPAPCWPVHLLLYGPRWVAAPPLALLVPLALALRLRWCALPLSLGLYSLAAISGVNVPWERLLVPGGSPGEPIRVLTCNVQGRDLKVPALAAFIRESRPDVVCLQECPPFELAGALGLGGWSSRSAGEFQVISRHPIVAFEQLRAGEAGSRLVAVRARLERSGRRIPVASVHLMTPRSGLEEIIAHRWEGLPRFRAVTTVQDLESRRLRRLADEAPDAAVLAGDFNLAAEQPVFRRDWSDLRDAFSWTGWGSGHTMFTRSIGLRIDHILCGPSWTPRSCEVGPDVGSAHRPVVAELAESGE